MQRNIEILIGKLVTDEDFRAGFLTDPHAALRVAADWGLLLSELEIRALLSTDQSLWCRIADELDGRLQKASLKNA